MDQKQPDGQATSRQQAAPPAPKEAIALVLECYARGYSSQQAADRAGVDLATVERILAEAFSAQDRAK